jgi:hypothetical protein
VLFQERNARIQKLPKILAFKNSITFSKQHEDFVNMGVNILKTKLKIQLTVVFHSKNENKKKLCSITKMKKTFLKKERKKNIVMKFCNKLIMMKMTTQT